MDLRYSAAPAVVEGLLSLTSKFSGHPEEASEQALVLLQFVHCHEYEFAFHDVLLVNLYN